MRAGAAGNSRPAAAPREAHGGLPECPVCPRHCRIAPGGVGACHARGRGDGPQAPVTALNYGRVTALALDPIEKKPLARFAPGSLVLSVGSYGCNLRCPFCQNHGIAQCGEADAHWESIAPAALAQKAKALEKDGNIGLAFTYNEPSVGWEYVRDAATAARALGLKNVMVTNGCFSADVMAALLPVVDAFNIDLKCFSEAGYETLGGRPPREGWLETVQAAIAAAARTAHVEVTTLVVPGLSDSTDEMARQAAWLAGVSPEIPLHLSRYFPCWKATAPPTPPETLFRLRAVAQRYLKYVFPGNI